MPIDKVPAPTGVSEELIHQVERAINSVHATPMPAGWYRHDAVVAIEAMLKYNDIQ